MKIELKKITYSKALSQETSAYTAVIYVDGKKRGDVRNDGGGGADMISPPTLAREINDYAMTLPPVDVCGVSMVPTAETVLGDILDKWLAAGELKRILKKKCLFFAADGKLYASSSLTPPKDSVTILNTLSFDEALRLYLTVPAHP